MIIYFSHHFVADIVDYFFLRKSYRYLVAQAIKDARNLNTTSADELREFIAVIIRGCHLSDNIF